MQKFIDIKLLKFIIVGIVNTAFSAVLMFIMYNSLHFGYWGASATAYILSSILSFFLNKVFTFKNKGSLITTAIKFSLNVTICYLIAYSLAQPCVIILLAKFKLKDEIVDQISMLFGMILFTGLNYFGQRFFAFKENA